MTQTPVNQPQKCRRAEFDEDPLLSSAGESLRNDLTVLHEHPEFFARTVPTSGLGYEIPWTCVAYQQDGRKGTGLVVSGTRCDGKWDLSQDLVIFDAWLGEIGSFLMLRAGKDMVEHSVTLPGFSPRQPKKPELLREYAHALEAWMKSPRLQDEWLERMGKGTAPTTFIEICFGTDRYRGLVIDGDRLPSGEWDYDGDLVLLSPSGHDRPHNIWNASKVEILFDGDQSRVIR
ncbi:hypothetical protein GOB86_12045 [Acetobacter lambici]|uniref:hypothetical protein n=1 Tax=Acetobacter lambici TaxID=1332824 RepID=UPI00140BE026|nr:hypothetical protein [Acetobacter lambici]NHO57774.1 hypothetical protein [Acetobacter lambici]